MNRLEFWKECVDTGADEIGLSLTEEQLTSIAESVMGGHENYGMAYYSPPASDRISEIENEWKAKHKRLQAEFEAYKRNAEQAVGEALRVSSFDRGSISIGEHGDVFMSNGRTTQIQ